MKNIVSAAFTAGVLWIAADQSPPMAIAILAFAVIYWGLRVEDELKLRRSREDRE